MHPGNESEKCLISNISPHKLHRPSMEVVTQRIREQNKCVLPKLEEIYMEPIRISSNSEVIDVEVSGLNWMLRAAMVSKAVAWHRLLKLNKGVLYDVVVMLDRFCSSRCVREVEQEQDLIVIAGLYLSYKRVQKRRKCLKQWLSTLNNQSYQPRQIVEMEASILEQLDYDLERTNSFDFMSFLTVGLEISETAFMLARYFLELSFFVSYQEFHPFVNYQALMGATSLYLSCYFLQPHKWTAQLRERMNVSQLMLEDCSAKLFDVVMQAKDSGSQLFAILRPVEDKFMKKCYLEIASMKFQPIPESETCHTQCQELEMGLNKSFSEVSTVLSNSASHQSFSEQRFTLQDSRKKIVCNKIRELEFEETSEEESMEPTFALRLML